MKKNPNRLNNDQFNLLFRAIELLDNQAKAISKAAMRLDSATVENVIKMLTCCSGKVVLTGIGKSGIVGRKIAATLTSTGTPAIYLHPSDALHGDLGIATTGDVAIVVSYSGETEEVVAMLPYLNYRKIPVIAIVGKSNSTIARKAEVVLDASIEKEVCPLNLAPTTSTSVALAIGDALAMMLMEVKGITLEDFALNHPSGGLGKRLMLRVGDLIDNSSNNPTIGADASWWQLINVISKGGRGAVSVVNDAGYLIGLITDGDLRRAIERINHADLENVRSSDIMTHNPITVTLECLAYDALQLMQNREYPISNLPVVDEGGICLGMIQLYEITKIGLS